MARSFSSPNFSPSSQQLRRIGKPSSTPRPENAFTFRSPTNYNISASAGEGIAAAGLSTLPEVYKSLSERSDFDGLASGLYAADQAEERAFVRSAGDILSNAVRNKYALMGQKISQDYQDSLNEKNEKNSWIQTALKTAIQIGVPMIAASDIDTKHTIDQLDDALYLLRELRPVTFYYKEQYSSSPERMHYGFIAQEYQKVMPDQTYFDESIGKLCIDPVELIGVLVRAIQQLDTKITRLEAKQALAGVK